MPERVRLPRGRHHLSRADVVNSQRHRMLAAMIQAMAEHGYVDTPVAEIIRRAGVSRETFYEQFTSKRDCFLAGLEQARERLDAALATARYFGGTPVERVDRLLGLFLEALALEPGTARLLLIEAYAAGPEAVRESLVVQTEVQAALHDALDATTDRARFACRVLTAAIVSLATASLAAGDVDGLRQLRTPLVDLVRTALAGEPAALVVGDGPRRPRPYANTAVR